MLVMHWFEDLCCGVKAKEMKWHKLVVSGKCPLHLMQLKNAVAVLKLYGMQ